MGYPTTALPTFPVKTGDYTPLDSAVPLSKGWTAADVAAIKAITDQLDSAWRGADWLGLKDMTGMPPDLSGTGLGRFAWFNDTLKWTRNGKQWASITGGPNDVSYDQFGIPTDGTDGTAALQAALDYFRCDTGGGKTGRLRLPPNGSCTISDTLVYHGSVSYSLLIEVMSGGVFGQTGFTINWAAGAGTSKRMLKMQGANGCEIRGLNLNGTNIAKGMLHWDIDIQTPTGGSHPFMPSSRNIVRSCTFYNHGGDNCDAIAVGHEPSATYTGDIATDPYINTQVSEVFVTGCTLEPRSDHKGYGFRALTGGNCKNFVIRDSGIDDCDIGISALDGGYCKVEGTNFGGIKGVCIMAGANALYVENCDYEGDSLDTSGVRGLFIDKGVSSTNPGDVCVVLNCQVFAPMKLASDSYTGDSLFVGVPRPDDTMIRAGSAVILFGNQFINCRGVGFSVNALPKVIVAANYDPNSSSSVGSLTSIGNWYRNAKQYVPCYDTNGNMLGGTDPFTGGAYGGSRAFQVVSLNDRGGQEGSTTNNNLRPCLGASAELTRSRVIDWGGDKYHQLLAEDGVPNRTITRVKLQADKFYSGANFALSEVAWMRPGQRLMAIEVVSTSVANSAGSNAPINVILGVEPTGYTLGTPAAALGAANLIQPTLLTGSQRIGHDPAAYGSGLLLMPPTGYYPDPSLVTDVETSGWRIFIVLVTADPAQILQPSGSLVVKLTLEADYR